jgi:type II secretory pathway component PulF
LKLIIENLKWQDEQAAYMKRLFIYPLFVSVAVLGTLFFLMTALVPELSKFVKAEGQELPWHTKVLILASQGVADYGYLALLALGLGVALVFLNNKRNPAFGLKNRRPATEDPGSGALIKKDDPRPLCQLFCPHVCLRDHGARVSTDR